MSPTREPAEGKTTELPQTRRLPRVVQALPPRWEQLDGRTFRYRGTLSMTIRLTADGQVIPFCVMPDGDGYGIDLEDTRRASSDLTALLSWVKGRAVEARQGSGGAA